MLKLNSEIDNFYKSLDKNNVPYYDVYFPAGQRVIDGVKHQYSIHVTRLKTTGNINTQTPWDKIVKEVKQNIFVNQYTPFVFDFCEILIYNLVTFAPHHKEYFLSWSKGVKNKYYYSIYGEGMWIGGVSELKR